MLITTEYDRLLEDAILRALIRPRLECNAALHSVSRGALSIIIQEFRIERRQLFVVVKSLFCSDWSNLITFDK